MVSVIDDLQKFVISFRFFITFLFSQKMADSSVAEAYKKYEETWGKPPANAHQLCSFSKKQGFSLTYRDANRYLRNSPKKQNTQKKKPIVHRHSTVNSMSKRTSHIPAEHFMCCFFVYTTGFGGGKKVENPKESPFKAIIAIDFGTDGCGEYQHSSFPHSTTKSDKHT